MKKIISLILCLSLLVCAFSMPTYAFETESNSSSNGVIDTIDYSEISPEMMEMFEEQNVLVDEASVVEVVEVTSGENVVNGLRVTNVTVDGVEKNSLFAISCTGEGDRSSGGVTDIVTRSLRRDNSYTWNLGPVNSVTVTCTAYFDIYISNLSMPSYGVRPKKVSFSYSKVKASVDVKKVFILYGCAGHVYSYPGWVHDSGAGTYSYDMSRTVTSPLANTTYSKTGGIASGKVIVPYLGDYYTRGHYISCTVTVNDTAYPGSIDFS